ncbi:hypothetical protein JCM14244_16550 [Venenivibrio stagnispumantis]|uniref:Uncharacterized protein n=1 Tax=Venenivibrio stagnispumantis TaxID=407998 RepID=A0AA45WPB9_9AQUI|nr:hypothetical protein [Venenivibrio stagnispumantis]MCW4573991.1 hypothetical protein [Venenivibrio stagnispumantis]SMP21101.1 hypothetical protein SAMN06264868_1227 [Venenivibrio stagnispumantis]
MLKKVLSGLIIAGVITQAYAGEDQDQPKAVQVEKSIIPELANKCAKKLGIEGNTPQETALNLFFRQEELTQCIQEEMKKGGKND